MAEPTDLAARRDKLDARLTDGWHRINDAEAQGREVSAWEDVWFGLLHEYEAVCDELRSFT